MTYPFGSAQHIGGRQQQQDAFGFSDPARQDFLSHGGFAAVVADGMGGLAHGDVAGRTAAKAFLAAYEAKTAGESIADALSRSLLAANEAVCDLADHLGASGDIGTTLVAAVVSGESLHWVSAGDSALFLYRDGRLTLLTTAHNYGRHLDRLAADGTLTSQQAAENPDREALTSFLGAQRQVPEIDCTLRPMPLQPGDWVLLSSDGLFRTLSSEAIEQIAAESPGDLQHICDALIQRTLSAQAPSQDNVTVVAIGPAGMAQSASAVTRGTGIPALGLSQEPLHKPASVPILVWLLALFGLAGAGYIFREPILALWSPPPLTATKPEAIGRQRYDTKSLPPSGEKAEQPPADITPGSTEPQMPAQKQAPAEKKQ